MGYKWLAVVVTSLHWFNPLMVFIRREINRACELSCDEAVIKNLGAADKQSYGETLISMVAEHRYPPIGVLSTTMCEEKENFEGKAASIMGSGRRSVMVAVIVLACMIIGGAAWLGGPVPPQGTVQLPSTMWPG